MEQVVLVQPGLMVQKWVESMRELLSGSHPGIVTKEDLAQVEDRLDELLTLMDAIEEKLGLSNPEGST